MPKIITITANTAIDCYLEVNGLELTDNIIAQNSAEFACGKGINVGKSIASLEKPVMCLGFIGEQSSQRFRDINIKGLQTDFIVVTGKTRTNITLFDTASQKEKHIRTHGFKVTEPDCLRLTEKIDALLVAGDIIILSGSLPVGAPNNFYQQLIELAHRKAAIAFLDSSGSSLAEGIKAKPYLIKPNLSELQELIGGKLTDIKTIIQAAHEIIAQGVDWVYVSRGEKGIIAVSEKLSLLAQVRYLPDKIVSQVGCGDALLAGLAVAYVNQLQLSETIQLALACATANLFCLEPGRFDSKQLKEIYPAIEITVL